jgi:hypothetical protein
VERELCRWWCSTNEAARSLCYNHGSARVDVTVWTMHIERSPSGAIGTEDPGNPVSER